MTDVKKIEKMSDQELRGELHEARAVIEHLQSELKGSVPLKYHDDLMHDWKVSEVAKDKRIAALEAALPVAHRIGLIAARQRPTSKGK